MGATYQKMAQDLLLKNLAEVTRKEYLRCCTLFVRYHMRAPDRMGLGEIKDYLGHLLRRGAGPETLKMNVAALKFLYGVTLDRENVAKKLPWPKVPHKKPDILGLSEVEQLLAVAETASLVPAVVAMAAYGAGLRIGEACRLRPEDIDSTRMLIHVRLGKGNKDRFVVLSPRLLQILRGYWVKAGLSDPTGWLFPGRKKGEPISPSAINKALEAAAKKAGIRKRITAHVLRHSFATHVHEAGTDIRTIQMLLGHASIRSTARYTHISKRHIAAVKSPLDRLKVGERTARR